MTPATADVAAFAEHLFGHVEHGVATRDAARHRFTRSVEGFRALAIPWGVGNSLNGLAKVALATNDVAAGGTPARRGRVGASAGCPWRLALVWFRRALLAVRRGNPAEAFARWGGKASPCSGSSATSTRIVYAMVPLAAAAEFQGDDLWAARILGRPGRPHGTHRRVGRRQNGCTTLEPRRNEKVRARLGPDGWDPAYAAGRVTSIDSLIKDIDRISRSHAPV